MTIRFMKAALAGTVFAAAFASTGAQAATATATAKAQILQQITVAKTSDLDYATIVTGAAASTVIVTPAGVRTCGAGLVCTGTATAAGFSVDPIPCGGSRYFLRGLLCTDLPRDGAQGKAAYAGGGVESRLRCTFEDTWIEVV